MLSRKRTPGVVTPPLQTAMGMLGRRAEPSGLFGENGKPRNFERGSWAEERFVRILVGRLDTFVKFILTFFAGVVLAGCASHSHPQPAVAAPSAASPAPSLFFRTITIVETNPVVFVDGEVMRPGRFIWSPGLTLTNAIALAGGFTDFADRRRLEVRRPGSIERYSYRQAVTNNVLLDRSEVVHVRRRFLW